MNTIKYLISLSVVAIQAGSTMTSGKDYTAEIEFVCQAV